jgi:molecular chaperone GrpE
MTQSTNRDPASDPGGAEVRDRASEAEEQRVIVRDKRRIDPESGALREGADAPPAAAASGGEPPVVDTGQALLQAQLDERTADLQRLKAEYDNYRRRVERDRVAVVEQAAGSVIAQLVPLLDDVERARQHGELDGAFKAVAETLEATLTKLGLERFGDKGDEFDPTRHEAVMHSYSDDVTTATCVDVMRPGYLFADRLLRPAMVAVADPTPGGQPTDH